MTRLRILMLALASAVVLIPTLHSQDLTDDLLAATRKGDVAAVKALLDRGANVNSKSAYGSTPLFFACDRGNVEMVKLLLERGADVNVEDTFYHFSALGWAMQKDRVAIMKLLLDHGAKSAAEVLQAGAQAGNAAWVKIALDTKGGVDAAAMSKALAAATKAKKTEVVEMLKAAGAVMPDPIKVVKLDNAVLTRYAGAYTGGRGGTEFEFTFTVKDGQLSGTLQPQPPLDYSATDATHFINDQFGIKIEFVFDNKPENNAPTGFKLLQGPANIEFKRKVASK
jgi:hypothetical protein